MAARNVIHKNVKKVNERDFKSPYLRDATKQFLKI